MQVVRRLRSIRTLFRSISSSIVNVTPSTTRKELDEINKLMKNYNYSHLPIRTFALFEWMSNIIDVKPDYTCYLHIIRACGELNNREFCRRLQHRIETDRTLPPREYQQLRIKLIYMYAKINQIDLAEEIFEQVKVMTNPAVDSTLFGTMFKAYNMNGQPEKTLILYEKELRNPKGVHLDAIAATCVLSACSDCLRLDIGNSVHEDVVRRRLLDPPNIRLVTAIMNMYCHCGSIDAARDLFDQYLPFVDHIAYSTLMQAYLSVNQPHEVLSLFDRLQSSSVISDSVLYLNVIHACRQIGLRHRAAAIHRSIPSSIIERNLSVQHSLIDMHAHCSQLDEASRLFHLLKQKENYSLANLLHGYAIHGQGQRALNLYSELQTKLKFNELVYRMILLACAYTGGLVSQARDIYRTIPEKFRTSEVAAAMISNLARASLFDEAESFIRQHQPISKDVSLLWSEVFFVCYHSRNVQFARRAYEHIKDDPLIALLYADMTNSRPSNEVIDHFRRQEQGKCCTEIEQGNQTSYPIHEFCDNDREHFPDLHIELDIIIDELKSVGVDWSSKDNDLKELFCGHTATHLAIAQNLISTLPTTDIQLTKSKRTCPVCHEGMKQLSLIRQRDIILRDCVRVHHFHKGHCSCEDRF